jgi:hypothetical protein
MATRRRRGATPQSAEPGRSEDSRGNERKARHACDCRTYRHAAVRPLAPQEEDHDHAACCKDRRIEQAMPDDRRACARPAVLGILKTAAVIVGCVDNLHARADLQELSWRLLIPYVDIGVNIRAIKDPEPGGAARHDRRECLDTNSLPDSAGRDCAAEMSRSMSSRIFSVASASSAASGARWTTGGHPTFGLSLLLLDGRRWRRQLGRAGCEALTDSWVKSG